MRNSTRLREPHRSRPCRPPKQAPAAPTALGWRSEPVFGHYGAAHASVSWPAFLCPPTGRRAVNACAGPTQGFAEARSAVAERASSAAPALFAESGRGSCRPAWHLALSVGTPGRAGRSCRADAGSDYASAASLPGPSGACGIADIAPELRPCASCARHAGRHERPGRARFGPALWDHGGEVNPLGGQPDWSVVRAGQQPAALHRGRDIFVLGSVAGRRYALG